MCTVKVTIMTGIKGRRNELSWNDTGTEAAPQRCLTNVLRTTDASQAAWKLNSVRYRAKKQSCGGSHDRDDSK